MPFLDLLDPPLQAGLLDHAFFGLHLEGQQDQFDDQSEKDDGNAVVSDKLIQPVDKLDYICSYIDNDLIDSEKYPELILQLQHYGAEINTLREADLCSASRIKERIYVSTVHKAKGLEFDNVIVYDAVDGRYPNFNATTINQKEEDARKLYVALSRAKKRLYIGISKLFINRYGRTFDRTITPFLKPVMDKFS